MPQPNIVGIDRPLPLEKRLQELRDNQGDNLVDAIDLAANIPFAADMEEEEELIRQFHLAVLFSLPRIGLDQPSIDRLIADIQAYNK
jgi:hypothetical protein